jgi:hypothetical protein
MPRRPIRQRENFSSTRANGLNGFEATLRAMQMPQRVGTWNNANQQMAFNRAIELYRRRPISAERKRIVEAALRTLVRNYNRTWSQPAPPASRFRVNYNSESNNNGSNSNEFMPRAVQAQNNNTGLHSLFIKTNLVKMPANKPTDSMSHHKFKKGDVATRIRQGGRNYYYRTGAFNRWFGHDWKHMSPNSNARISNKTHPETRATVTRRNVSRVKFV